MKHNTLRLIVLTLFWVILSAFGSAGKTYAASFVVSPMHQQLILIPGETTKGSFYVSAPAVSDEAIKFDLEVEPFFIDNDDNVTFPDESDYSQIVDWISLNIDGGGLEPNERVLVTFKIDVPEDAPAGGQYAAIVVKTDGDDVGMISQSFEIAHLIYGEVAGETNEDGTINLLDVPSFISTGNITGGTSITNNGNVHSNATHVLKVYPLFSDEEYYTNEEDPQVNLIMPGATRYTSITWDKTPRIGLFRVDYTVQYNGLEREINKMVIVCPIWLLIIFLAVIVCLVLRFALGRAAKSKERR